MSQRTNKTQGAKKMMQNCKRKKHTVSNKNDSCTSILSTKPVDGTNVHIQEMLLQLSQLGYPIALGPANQVGFASEKESPVVCPLHPVNLHLRQEPNGHETAPLSSTKSDCDSNLRCLPNSISWVSSSMSPSSTTSIVSPAAASAYLSRNSSSVSSRTLSSSES
jgi:hypothetical protein